MDLLKKVRPTSIEDVPFYRDQIEEALQWIQDFKDKKDRKKKVLLIIGDTGSGKTILAQLLFQALEYQIIELNGTNLRSQKKLGEFLHKALGFRNVIDMFHERKKPIGLIMDEIETLMHNTDKGGFNEFIQILKDYQKYEKNIEKNKKQKIDMNTFIHIENPIICTYTKSCEKKIQDLKNLSHVIELNDIPLAEYKKFTESLVKKKFIQKIELPVIKEMIRSVKNDIRRFIYSVENIQSYKYHKNLKSFSIDDYHAIECINDPTKNDIQIKDAIEKIMTQDNSYSSLDLIYDLDPFIVPYTIYQNGLSFLDNSSLTKNEKVIKYSQYIKSLSEFDQINSLIYENNNYYEIENSLKFHGIYYPSQIFDNIHYKKKHIPIEFTNIHNKTSQMLVNRKLIIQSKQSLKKKYINTNSLILDCEILFHYFNDFIECVHRGELNDLHEKKLIQYMNQYKIQFPDLENILKIEKINKNEDKRRKNMNMLIKDKIIQSLDY